MVVRPADNPQEASLGEASLPREKQVAYVVTLLERRGESIAVQLRKRILEGQAVVAKGFTFHADVLREALQKWLQEGSRNASFVGGAVSGGAPGAQVPRVGAQRPATATGGAKAGAQDSPGGGRRQLKRKVSAMSEASEPSTRTGPAATGVASRAGPPTNRRAPPPAAAAAAGSATLPRALPRGAGTSGTRGRAPPVPEPESPPGPPSPGPMWELKFSPTKRKSARPTDTAARGQTRGASPSKENEAPCNQAGRNEAKRPCPSADDLSSLSVKELKALLEAQGLDFVGAVEKAELQALWSRFALLRSRPLRELQAACLAQGGPQLPSVEACARFLATPQRAAPAETQRYTAPAAPAVVSTPAEPEDAASAAQRRQAAVRQVEAQTEVSRILKLRREGYRVAADWGFAVLGIEAGEVRDTGAVQKAYRALMKRLHPDKVGQATDAARAVELVRDAKDVCERSLCSLEVPHPPVHLRSECICPSAGRRRFRLSWDAPQVSERRPIRRYVVAAFDPAYGRALTVTVLEPDYSEELKRFVSVEELTWYVLAEEDLQKMPQLWQQSTATVQVASANEAGQSPWATLQVPLIATPPRPVQPTPPRQNAKGRGRGGRGAQRPP